MGIVKRWFKGLPEMAYRAWRSETPSRTLEEDPILTLVGSGKELWGDEDPNKYVKHLREHWE